MVGARAGGNVTLSNLKFLLGLTKPSLCLVELALSNVTFDRGCELRTCGCRRVPGRMIAVTTKNDDGHPRRDCRDFQQQSLRSLVRPAFLSRASFCGWSSWVQSRV